MTVTPFPSRDEQLADDRRAVLLEFVDRALGALARKPTVDVEDLARIMGWGRSTAYQAVRVGVPGESEPTGIVRGDHEARVPLKFWNLSLGVVAAGNVMSSERQRSPARDSGCAFRLCIT